MVGLGGSVASCRKTTKYDVFRVSSSIQSALFKSASCSLASPSNTQKKHPEYPGTLFLISFLCISFKY
ncbi:hypothetical protein DWX41_19325 [Hungatella hathewayi]|uniref:Uncharacterized protein n=1 Tax=Hungatella hathewayi TaxID=154046 RepID=A0A3E2WHD5_9FIRM|nr:hypothetical protein DWX41_19325 [Hungatella hathewayi]